jgi:hypothetical protein
VEPFDPTKPIARHVHLIDLAGPVCVILSGVLHFAPPVTARDVAAAFARAIVPAAT